MLIQWSLANARASEPRANPAPSAEVADARNHERIARGANARRACSLFSIGCASTSAAAAREGETSAIVGGNVPA
jgi:hypothetical protein